MLLKFVGKLCTKLESISCNLICDVKSKSQVTMDRCAGHANFNRHFHTSTLSFFCMDELSISSTLWDHLRSCAKIYVNVCVCVCGEERKKETRIRGINFL